MSFLEFVIRTIEAIIWPGLALVVIYLLRHPLKTLVPLIEKLQYKELAISFRNAAEGALESVEAGGSSTVGATTQLKEIVDPQLAVLGAWRDLEEAAMAKFRELASKKEIADFGSDRALEYFEYMGALIPHTRQTLFELKGLRNQAAHQPASTIPIEGAQAYVKAAATICRQIEALSALPQVKLNRLTVLILEYNHLLDTGKYNHITIEDIHREIEQGTILRFIKDVAGTDVDLSLYLDGRDELGFEGQYSKHLQSIYGGYAGQEVRKWGVKNLGLCLLIAWTNEIVQRGSGWQPDTNVA